MTTRRRGRRRATPHPEAGQSLVELLIAMLMFSVLLIPTVAIVTSLSRTSVDASKTSISTESAQVGADRLEGYIENAVSPNLAVNASNGALKLTATGPCWGTSQPNEAGGLLLDYSGETGAATLPSLSSVIEAHDFDLEFCGLQPGTHTPNVYRIWLTQSPSSGEPCTASVCTIELDEYLPSSTGSPYNTYTYTGPCSALTLQCHPVLDIPNVACDSDCADQTFVAQDNVTNDAIACIDRPGATAAGCATATPPLFTYYGSGGAAGGSLNPSGLPLLDIYSNDTNDATPGCLPSPTTGALSNCADLSEISSVGLNFTILGSTTTASSAKGSEVHRTEINDQVFMTNLVSPATAPYAPGSVTAASEGGTACTKSTTETSACTVNVTWTVSNSGGSTITGFTVIPFLGSTEQTTLVQTVTTGTAGCSADISGTPGATDCYQLQFFAFDQYYTFTVQATNEIGTSAPSLASTPVEVT